MHAGDGGRGPLPRHQLIDHPLYVRRAKVAQPYPTEHRFEVQAHVVAVSGDGRRLDRLAASATQDREFGEPLGEPLANRHATIGDERACLDLANQFVESGIRICLPRESAALDLLALARSRVNAHVDDE